MSVIAKLDAALAACMICAISAGCSGDRNARSAAASQAVLAGPATPTQYGDGTVRRLDGTVVSHAELDAAIDRLREAARVPGVAIAIINDGRVVYLAARGWRNVLGRAPMTVDTALPGASFTKAAFAVRVMRLVEQGRLDLDTPIEHYLGQPLATIPGYQDLAGDPRAQRFTARMLLSHTSGMPNWRRFNANGKLDIRFEPGARYSYSGEGIYLLQRVVEQITRGDAAGSLTEQMADQVFRPFGMARTSMVWLPAFEADHATPYDAAGAPLEVSRRRTPDAAGSMSTTIRDWSALLAGLTRGEVLPATARAEMLRPQIRIRAKYQFPPGGDDISTDHDGIALSYGLGWGVFTSPHGAAFFKEGHDDGAQSYCVVFDGARSAIAIMTNSDNGESIFKELLEIALGDTYTPWAWNRYLPYQQRSAP